MRWKVLLALLASAVPAAAPPASAVNPLARPESRLSVSLLERVASGAAPLALRMTYTPTRDFGAIVLVGFQRKGQRRLLFEGARSGYVEARRGGVYPSVVAGGEPILPPCPAAGLCSSPAIPGDYTITEFSPADAAISYYVYAHDIDVRYDVGSGWRLRPVRGGALHQVRDTGTSARLSAGYRQYMVEDFRGAVAPPATAASVAFATIPCWFAPLPNSGGRAVLRDSRSRTQPARPMDCESYAVATRGASERPAVWLNEGKSLGWSGGFVNRLVVAVLPPA